MLPVRLLLTNKIYFTCFPRILTAVQMIKDFFDSHSCCFVKLINDKGRILFLMTFSTS